MVTARFVISGKVQGVWFRASTRVEAVRLGLRGYACNLADGCVEVLAVGNAESIEQLSNWLQHGPPLAHVEAVEHRDSGGDVDANHDAIGFQIR